ncbi:hypothetical protein AB1L42_08855 [Thalassoglobus sp. JC818]|uniref:hypothetical protein n=1 Tax=Thalassoglobus sp. JC818 TaxID=3232136 RepID=UPI00345A7CAF
MSPITYPAPWPPPSRKPDFYDRIPVAGEILRSICELATGSAYWKSQNEIANQIEIQLQARSGERFEWPAHDEHQIVLEALQETVCFWKGVDQFCPHPDDPAVLLFWGPFDDLSPLCFQTALEKKIERRPIPHVSECIFGPVPPLGFYDVGKALSSKCTIGEVLNFYVNWMIEDIKS